MFLLYGKVTSTLCVRRPKNAFFCTKNTSVCKKNSCKCKKKCAFVRKKQHVCTMRKQRKFSYPGVIFFDLEAIFFDLGVTFFDLEATFFDLEGIFLRQQACFFCKSYWPYLLSECVH